MMMHRMTTATAVALALIFALQGQARAETADREVARVHFERGVALYEAANYRDALDEFQAAYEAQPHPAVLVNIANCFARTDRPIRAIRGFERYLRERSERVGAAERSDIERIMAEQRQLVGELRITVEGIEGQLRIDGLPVGTAPIEHTELVRAGEHRVEVRPATGEPVVRPVTVEGGGSATVAIAPAPEPLPPPPGGGDPGEGGTEPTDPTEPTPPVEPAEPEDEPIAMLAITGSRGARIYIDGDRVGRIPYEEEVEPGEHDLRLAGPGLLTYETDLDLEAGERTEVEVDLSVGQRPGLVPIVEWSLVGLAGAMLVTGIGMTSVGWARFVDSEAMYTEIQDGRYSSRAEQDLMWDRYDTMYDEYLGLWQGGWAMVGIGLAAAVAAATMFILDHGVGMFAGRPRAEIDIMPLDEVDEDDEDLDDE